MWDSSVGEFRLAVKIQKPTIQRVVDARDKRASSEHRKRAKEATSSGSAILPIGCAFERRSNTSVSRPG